MKSKTLILIAISIIFSQIKVYSQSPFWEEVKKQPATLGINNGSKNFELKNFNLSILNASQTVSSLKLKTDNQFDYTPDELLNKRDRDKFFHLGDINLTIKAEGTTDWKSYSSSNKR